MVSKIKETKEPSEFGSGFIICLVKFYEHFASKNYTYYADEIQKSVGEYTAAELFINGASDHLYDITCPKGKKWDSIRLKVEELQSRAIRMGHGFTGEKFGFKKIRELQVLAEEIIVKADKILIGKTAEWGNW
jgi:hypothetical protein